MDLFSVAVEVANPEGGEFAPVELLVDTGAYYTFLPRSLLEALGVPTMREQSFRLADGSSRTWSVGEVRFRIEGDEFTSPVVFGDEGVFLLGAVTLEIFALIPDTTHKKLVPPPEVLAVGARLASPDV